MICENEYHIAYAPISCTLTGVHCKFEHNKKECPDFRNKLLENSRKLP